MAHILVAFTAALLVGCGSQLDTEYGRVAGKSINGTGVLADLFRDAGHEVRVAKRLTDAVAERAETIVRFSPRPGPIDREEAQWYLDWQESGPGRKLIYVCRDYDVEPEYWAGVLARLPKDAKPSLRHRIERLQESARQWPSRMPDEAEDPADPGDWFAVKQSDGDPTVSTRLGGPWASDIDAKAAALVRRTHLRSNSEMVLLAADDQTMAMQWGWESHGYPDDPGTVLVLASPAFLLNGALVNSARRPLALRVVNWAGSPPRTVVFVEGNSLFAEEEGLPSLWELIERLPQLRWPFAHFVLLGLATALARAMILGRCRPSPSTNADRPRAHAEALGALLRRSRDVRLADRLLKNYQRWRHPGGSDPSSL